MMHEVLLDMNTLRVISIVATLLICGSGATGNEGCQSPQYMEVGHKGTIICSFQEDFSTIYWYNSRNFVTEQSIVQYKDSIKRGEGITSGEFDIHPNGSLIINNVTYEHDHDFTVIKLKSVLDDYVPHYVRVIVTVKPDHPYPVIEQCGNEERFCFSRVQEGHNLTCFVRDTRPGVALKWTTRTNDGDRNVTFNFLTQHSGQLMTSIARTFTPFAYTSGLSLLVCNAEASPGLLEEHETLIIVQSQSITLSSVTPVAISVQMNRKLELKCAHNTVSYLVWKYKHPNNDDFQEVLVAVVVRDNLTIMKDGYELELGESLVISAVEINNEGIYGCIYGNGTSDGMTAYDVQVYVPPDPAYPVVEGCNHEQYCTLQVQRDDTLTCTVANIRPKVKLIWKAVQGSKEISFHTQETTVSSNWDGTFDVRLTSRYETRHVTTTKFTVECAVIGTNIEKLQLATILDLLIVAEEHLSTESHIAQPVDGNRSGTSLVIVIVITAIIVIIAVVLAIAGVCLRAKCINRRLPVEELDKDATNPMLPLQVSSNLVDENNYKAKKENFVTQLKTKYDDMCASICPVPYMREKMFSVDKIYVEGGFEYMDRNNRWIDFQSHHEILEDSNEKPKRYIIEGNAGYGKSTLALRFAYEWSHNIAESPLQNKDIFILLRLRQLQGVESVYRVIKRLLLPKDTLITAADIEMLLQKSKSVVVVLDGFDEYQESEKEDSFVMNIIQRQIFQQFNVILTTRSGFLPKDFSPQTTRIRLTGFHDKAQEKYLQQVVVGESGKSTDKIKETLQKNPFLDDICRVPIFFVLFAHICNNEDHIKTFSSVTPFFRHIISCLHNHRKNKLKHEDAGRYNEKYETDHSSLDKVAFDGLCNSKQLVWTREKLIETLGEDFYLQYSSIGVLVEEEVTLICDDPGIDISEHVQKQKQVTFYHKLFCEWYAAHYLAGYAAKPGVKLDPREQTNQGTYSLSSKITHSNDETDIQNLDPADVQYVYRFACGLRPKSADKIYQYLKSRCGGDKFAILCLLEETGQIEKIRKEIKKMCESTIIIHGSHSKLDQQSTIQHLEIASRQEIPITHLWLTDCFETVNDTWRQLILTSGCKIPKLSSLQSLDIRENGREIKQKETQKLLQYCMWCPGLMTIKFVYCLMPQSIHMGSLELLQKRNAKVIWDTDFSTVFKLDLASGNWQHEDGGIEMTEAEYKEQVDVFQRLKSTENRNGTTTSRQYQNL